MVVVPALSKITLLFFLFESFDHITLILQSLVDVSILDLMSSTIAASNLDFNDLLKSTRSTGATSGWALQTWTN